MKVVIVGGGFAGMNLAKSLSGKQGIHVVIVDKNNYHFFPPLIYQVATAFIEPSNISYPFRKMFQDSDNIRFVNGKLLRVNTEQNILETDSCDISYDVLVIATGTETNYFGMDQVREHALPMKTIDDALNLRNQLLLNLEHATRTRDAEELQRLTTVVIAGGGPTGVEIAGMMAEMNRHIVSKDYPELNRNMGGIYLIDAAPVLLGPMSVKAQQEALKTLQSLGVKIMLNVAVKGYENETVVLSDGTSIKTANLIWASGVIASAAPGLPENATTRGRRIIVDAYNKVVDTKNVYAIGDVCFQSADPAYPNGHPQLAQVAIQQGKNLALNLARMLSGRTDLKAFRYKNKGSMAIISKFKAVVDLPRGFFKGFFAWLTWLFIHIIPIAGFRNKVKLALNWFWSFITNDPTLRLIIRPNKDLAGRHEKEID
ncbi:NAD(P)/FAD-dependent oxidoreductase [Rurimicrobium arvi]|uniref:NADH:ubiquinone reductase (non-electrogenic) n=1 Tax=Rurimicrobium arvi TaxID=2049916 RepID=A0ABP8MCX8_9BACT